MNDCATFRYSLRHLLLAIACFAVAFATYPMKEFSDRILFVTLIGGGIGCFVGRFWIGTIIGFFIALVLVVVKMLTVWSTFHV